MLVLVGKSPATLEKHRRPNLGLLTSPRIGTFLDDWANSGGVWAADNDAFNDGFNAKEYERMLVWYEQIPGCLWVAVPDVVGDADATLDLWDEWVPRVAWWGYPVALVAQDGMTSAMVPWREVDCLFIGGTTEWKLGFDAESLVYVAQENGVLVHMGRVNTRRRIRYAKALGCDSVDGTSAVKWTDLTLPWMLDWAAAPQQTMLQSTEEN